MLTAKCSLEFLLPLPGVSATLRVPDLLHRGLALLLQFLGQLIQHVHHLVIPAALLSALGIDAPERSPETEATIADRELGCVEPPRLHVPQHSAPALG